jgi:RimJ/RimL family protein N-acetyltransferase
MRWADIAISGSGTTTYELACMGVPMLLMVLAENQRDVALQWESTGTAINLGWHTDITPGKIREAVQVLDQDAEKRSLMSKQGQSHVDGYGALRVCRELSGDPLWLREAVSDDCMLIFTWANEPEARAASFSSEAIAEKEHVQWFTKKLSLHHDRLYIGMDSNDLPVGLVRFAIEEKRATISVNLDKASRGKGYGTVMITQGCHRLFATSACENIDAFIKPENSASAKAFGKAGFVACPQEKIQDQYALRMSLSRSTMLL